MVLAFVVLLESVVVFASVTVLPSRPHPTPSPATNEHARVTPLQRSIGVHERRALFDMPASIDNTAYSFNAAPDRNRTASQRGLHHHQHHFLSVEEHHTTSQRQLVHARTYATRCCSRCAEAVLFRHRSDSHATSFDNLHSVVWGVRQPTQSPRRASSWLGPASLQPLTAPAHHSQSSVRTRNSNASDSAHATQTQSTPFSPRVASACNSRSATDSHATHVTSRAPLKHSNSRGHTSLRLQTRGRFRRSRRVAHTRGRRMSTPRSRVHARRPLSSALFASRTLRTTTPNSKAYRRLRDVVLAWRA